MSSVTDKDTLITKSKEVVRLERGTIEYELLWYQQKIVSFKLACAEVAPFAWLTQVPVRIFHERALAFLRLITNAATIKTVRAACPCCHLLTTL